MLKSFEVINFKGFENRITLDFSSRDYSFNSPLIKDGLVNKAIIYGKNGSGKSNLGIAIFDIVAHLTDKPINLLAHENMYINLNHLDEPAIFKYEFQFDNDIVVYEYSKKGIHFLLSEKMIINGVLVLNYDYFGDNKYISSNILGELNADLIDSKISIVKYIYRSTPTGKNRLIEKLVKFVENMLWFRSLTKGNEFEGFTNQVFILSEKIYEKGKLQQFTEFLKDNGIDYELGFENINGVNEVIAYFDQGKAKLRDIASTGTMCLFLFFVWMILAFENASFVFIDEFDAFLHIESSISLVKYLNRERQFQSIITTHNNSLMNNNVMRPDCCFLIQKGQVSSLANSTNRELREGHNIQKLYLSGEFNEQN